MIFAIAAALAAAAPAPAACPDVITPDALVCRALEAQKSGKPEEAAQSFEEAAKASSDKDPRTARMWAAAGNLWISGNQPGKAALDLVRETDVPRSFHFRHPIARRAVYEWTSRSRRAALTSLGQGGHHLIGVGRRRASEDSPQPRPPSAKGNLPSRSLPYRPCLECRVAGGRWRVEEGLL